MPKPTAAASASGTSEARLWPFSGWFSAEASITPSSASPIPTSAATPGLSPRASPTTTGSAAPVAETGATMLILPIAMPR